MTNEQAKRLDAAIEKAGLKWWEVSTKITDYTNTEEIEAAIEVIEAMCKKEEVEEVKEMQRIELNETLLKWFNDGNATWSYRGANDGEDGIFGGTFHSISDIKEVEDNEFEVYVDFGSADKEMAMDELNYRLEALKFIAEEEDGYIKISKAVERGNDIKALRIYVYRENSLGDCTNGGISSKYDELLLECEDGNIDIDENNLPENLVVIAEGFRGYKYIRPYKEPDHLGWMSGGNMGFSSDARFNSEYPLKIHDRQETQEMYDRLSI